jgi:hypothetical protein
VIYAFKSCFFFLIMDRVKKAKSCAVDAKPFLSQLFLVVI